MEKAVNFITCRYIDATTWPGFEPGLDGNKTCYSECTGPFCGFVVQFSVSSLQFLAPSAVLFMYCLIR